MNKIIFALVALFAVAVFAAVDPAVVAAVTNAGTVVSGTPFTVDFAADDNNAQAFVAYTAPAGTAYIKFTTETDAGDVKTYINAQNFIFTNTSQDSGSAGDWEWSATTEWLVGMGFEASSGSATSFVSDLSSYFDLNGKTIYFSIQNTDATAKTVTLTITEEVMLTPIALAAAGTAVTGAAVNSANSPPVYMLTNIAADYVWEITDANSVSKSIWNPMPAAGASNTDYNLANAGVTYVQIDNTASTFPSFTANVLVGTAQAVVWGTPTDAVTIADGSTTEQVYILNFDLTDAQLATVWELVITADADLSANTGGFYIQDAVSAQSFTGYYMSPAGGAVQPPASSATADFTSLTEATPAAVTTFTYTKGSTFYYAGWAAGSYQMVIYYSGNSAATVTFALQANAAIDTTTGAYCTGTTDTGVTVLDGLCTCGTGFAGATCAAVVVSTAETQTEPALPANGAMATVTVAAVDAGNSNSFLWSFAFPQTVLDGAIYVAGVYSFSNTANNAQLLNGSGGSMAFTENAVVASPDASDVSLVGTGGAWDTSATGVWVSSAAVDDTFIFVGGWGDFGAAPASSAAFAVNPVVFVVLAALSLVALF